MSKQQKSLSNTLLTLSAVFSLAVLLFLPSVASAAPTGTNFSHIIIIAMENQDYGSVIGSSSAPFINSLASAGATMSNYQAYAQGISGCSAGCYQAFTAGQVVGGDGWCPRASSPCQNVPTIADQLSAAGLTSAAFCEDGCPRGADHFPWIGYTNTWNNCVTGSFTCNGSTTPSGMLLYGTTDALGGSTSYSSVQSNAGNSAFINYLNGANPANYIWFTPTDSHNMHDNSIATGDNYLASLLCGCGAGGTLTSPNSGTVFSTSLWKSGNTLLYIWWDENSNPPNVLYGPMIKSGYTSTNQYDEYNALHTIEENWALPYITTIVSNASPVSDVFGTWTPPSPTSLSASLSLSTSTPDVGSSVTFTGSASGGTAPYTYDWNFGDGSTATGASATHSYSKTGTYTVTMNATDSTGQTTTKTQQINVGQTSSPSPLPNATSTITFLVLGLVIGGVAGVTVYLARYHSHNNQLRKSVAGDHDRV
jgi:PKD repeat protein